MPYTIIDAIKGEIAFLSELTTLEDSLDHAFASSICRSQQRSLERIIARLEKGYDYEIKTDKTTNKPAIFYRMTDRKTLQEEYPVLRKLAEQYELVENLVQADTVVK